MKKPNIHIGTSGFSYGHWEGTFYPDGIKPSGYLDYYLKHFRTVEINNSFYHLPQEKTFAAWRDSVPDDFVFAVKASRFITHMKKLSEPKKSIKLFFDRVSALGKKCGPVLFQLPPRWHCNIERLSDFLKALPKCYKYAFEFRDVTWCNNDVTNLLQKYNAAFCIYDLSGYTSPRFVTADFAYIRLHGPDRPYAGSYSEKELKEWAVFIKKCYNDGKDVFCYFNNDEWGYAPKDALRLMRLIKTR